MTSDKPEAVLAYYIHAGMPQHWTPTPDSIAESEVAVGAGQPAWLTFRRSGYGRLDLQLTTGLHPKTKHPVTLIFYESHFKD